MRRKAGSAPGRALRVTEQLHQELAEILRAEVKDPRIGMVTVTSVDLTADYAYATVWFSVLPDDPETVASTLQGLRAAAGYVRSLIGRRVRIHTTPEIRFAHDRSTERGMALSQLIDQANALSASDPDAEPHADPGGKPDADHAQGRVQVQDRDH
jgi:ribosome-binding factor A